MQTDVAELAGLVLEAVLYGACSVDLFVCTANGFYRYILRTHSLCSVYPCIPKKGWSFKCPLDLDLYVRRSPSHDR